MKTKLRELIKALLKVPASKRRAILRRARVKFIAGAGMTKANQPTLQEVEY
jgi:hypothetical protein